MKNHYRKRTMRVLYPAVKRLIHLTFLLLTLGVTLAHAESSFREDPRESIKIGALMLLTGPFAQQGNAFREGMELAIEEANSKNELEKYSLELLMEDTQGAPKNALTAARKLISVDKVVAAITSAYPDTKIGGGVFEANKIPTIALWDSSPEIDELGEYIFSLGPWVPSAGEKSATFAKENLSAKKAVVIATVEEWSELVADYFIDHFKSLGGTISGRHVFNPENSDFRSILTRIEQNKPDVIYAPLTHNIVAFHKQRKQLQSQIPVISSDIIAEEHILKAPKALEGVYQTATKDPENKKMEELAEKYRKKFKKDMTMPWFVSTGYDAVLILSHAIQTVGSDSEKIKDVLYSVQNFQGAAQTISISKNGSSPHYATMFQVDGGKFQSRFFVSQKKDREKG